jgi:hypothetical protein
MGFVKPALTGTKAALLTAKRHQFFIVAGLTTDPQKTMFKPSTF